jgi:hypothetical protein
MRVWLHGCQSLLTDQYKRNKKSRRFALEHLSPVSSIRGDYSVKVEGISFGGGWTGFHEEVKACMMGVRKMCVYIAEGDTGENGVVVNHHESTGTDPAKEG